MNNPLEEDLDQILAHTRPFWEELRGNRLFITGGTGFLGCWLLESFVWARDRLDLDVDAVVLTRRPGAFAQKFPHLASHPGIHLLGGDVCTFAFPEGPFSHIIHAATESSTSLNEDDPLQMLDTIITGTRRTLELAVRCGARKFLLTSSGAVYGRQPPDITHVPEEYEGAPYSMDARSAYGEGKRVAELLCAIYARQAGLETKIARCFTFVGPYLPLNARFAAGNFIRDALTAKPIEVQLDGTASRSYMDATDLAIWLWTILFRGKACHPYNVGSENELTIAELAQKVAGLNRPALEVRVQKPTKQAGPTQRYVPCTRRAREELALVSMRSLDDSLQRTLVVHQKRNEEPPLLEVHGALPIMPLVPNPAAEYIL